MLNQLSWPTIQTRHRLSRLHILHKGLYHQLSLTIPLHYLAATRSTTQYHPLHYILSYSYTTTAHQNSYFSRTISDWNMFPTHLINVTDTNTFKTELQSLLQLCNLCDCKI